jgi:folate/biopterin transporter
MFESLSSRPTRRRWLRTLLFDNEPSLELLAIVVVYFTQGILNLTTLATSFLLKDELGLSPAQTSAFIGIAALPWTVKILWGILSDTVPIGGYRRRSYLLLAGLSGAGALLALGTVVHSTWAAVTAIMIQSWAIAMSDVIADSLVAERAQRESTSQIGSLQSLCWGATAVGGIVAAYLGGLLVQHLGVHPVFLIASVFPLLVAFMTGSINEPPLQQRPDTSTLKVQANQLRQAVTNRQIWLPMVFILVWQLTPNADSAFFFFGTNELGFKPEFLGRVHLATSMASLLGVWLFQRFLKTVPFRKIFGWTIVISTLLGLTSLILVTHTNRLLGISDQWFSFSDGVVLAAAGRIAHMPFFVLAARLCPPGIEATLFALLMSIYNLGGILSQEFGSLLTQVLGVTELDFTNLWLLITITNLSSLIPLPFIGLLPGGDKAYTAVKTQASPERDADTIPLEAPVEVP